MIEKKKFHSKDDRFTGVCQNLSPLFPAVM